MKERLLQRASLTPNISETKGAIDRLFTLMRRIAVYVSAVSDVDLGPVSIFGSKVDAFENRPELKRAVEDARAHNAPWSPIVYQLLTNLLSASGVTSSLTAASAAIEQIFDAADREDRDVTAAERRAIVTHVKNVASYVRSQRDDLKNLHTRSLSVSEAMVADYTPLATGAHRFEQAIADVDRRAIDILIQFTKPESQPLYPIAVQQIAAVRKKLVDVNGAVQTLPGLNKTAAESFSDLLTVWVTVSEKYDGVVAELTVAEQSGESLNDLTVMLEVAAGAWQQIVDYIYGRMAGQLAATATAAA